jgi:hypothetical protein
MNKGKIHLGKELPTYDIKGKRVRDCYFDFNLQIVKLTLCHGMGGKERVCRLDISFENAQEIGLINLEVLNNFFKTF